MENLNPSHLDISSVIKAGFSELKSHPLTFLACLALLTADHFAFSYLISLDYHEYLPWSKHLVIIPLNLIFLLSTCFRSVVELLFLNLLQKKAFDFGKVLKNAFLLIGNYFLNLAWILSGILTIVPAFRRLILSTLIILKIDREGKCGWSGLKEIERRAGGKWVDLLWITLVVSLIAMGIFFIPSLIPGIPKSEIRALRLDFVNLFLLLVLNKYFGFFHEERLPKDSIKA